MNKKTVGSKDAADKLVKNIRRRTSRKYSAEEKIRIVLAGLRGEETKLTWVGYKGEPNHALIRAIVTAQAWVEEIKAGRSVSDILHAQNISEGRIWKRIRLAFLSPKILRAIVDGTTNRDLTIKMLTRHDLPLDWSEQESLFLSWIPCYCQLNSLLFFKAVLYNPNKHWVFPYILTFQNIKKSKIPC